MARHPRWVRALFSEDDLAAIAQVVAEAESATSAEIRVHLERRVPPERGTARAEVGPGAGHAALPAALRRARDVFALLEMHRTALRHGVLIYLALDDRQVAIVGDEGIHARVGDAYWPEIRDLMVERLRRGEACAAVVGAVRELAGPLARHFPRQPGDDNELSDSVSVEP
jgi:uncharacterized membrane protein